MSSTVSADVSSAAGLGRGVSVGTVEFGHVLGELLVFCTTSGKPVIPAPCSHDSLLSLA